MKYFIYTAMSCVFILCAAPSGAQDYAPPPLGNTTGTADMKRDPITTRAQTMGRSDINVTTQSDDFDYDYDYTDKIDKSGLENQNSDDVTAPVSAPTSTYLIDKNSPEVLEDVSDKDAFNKNVIKERADLATDTLEDDIY